jgi:cob(I)alamin adenosyltransferase
MNPTTVSTPAEVLKCVRGIVRRIDERDVWSLDAYGELKDAADRGNARASGLLSLIELVSREGKKLDDVKLWERVLDIPRQFTRGDVSPKEVIEVADGRGI